MKATILFSAMVLLVSAACAAGDKKGDAAKGKEVFEQCSVCHNVDSPERKMGPSLKGLFTHPKLVNGKKVTEDNVLDKINTGGNGMPSYKDLLTDQEKQDVIAYLKTV